MPESRDSASARLKGRVPWDDDEVEIRDLDPALDLDVFAAEDGDAIAAVEPEVSQSRDAELKPRATDAGLKRAADGGLTRGVPVEQGFSPAARPSVFSLPTAPPLPAVVDEEQMTVPEPSPVVVEFPRSTANAEMQALLESVRSGTKRPPASARHETTEPNTRTTDGTAPVAPQEPAGATRATREHLPLAIVAGLLVLLAVSGGAILWSKRGAVESPDRTTLHAAAESEAVETTPRAPSGSATPSRDRVATGAARRPARKPQAVPSAKSPAAPKQLAARTSDRAVATTGRSIVNPPVPRHTPPRAAPARRPPPPRDASGAVAGWLRIDAPSELQLTVDGVASGSTRQAPLLVAAGEHEIVLASDRAGVRKTARIVVAAGEVSTVPVTLPQGMLSVTAQPDADVFVDGQPAGRTPVDRLALTVGVRQIVVRHPQLGERSYEVVVREGRQTQLSVDLQVR